MTMPWLILGFFMACLRVDFTVSDSLFVVWGLDNGDNEHLGSKTSARELRECFEGVGFHIGNFWGWLFLF